MDRKDLLDYLQKDRRVDTRFIERLEEAGFEIDYDKFDYWDHQEYVAVGLKKVWLVAHETHSNHSCIVSRKRNEFIKELKEVMDAEKKRKDKEVEEEEEFFKMINCK